MRPYTSADRAHCLENPLIQQMHLAERNKMPSDRAPTDYRPVNERFKRGGKVKRMASGGMTSNVSSASKRADGIATKGKTRGKMY